ncbi:RadC family protein [Thiomicrospira sp. ALE5]|uniref:JAB domain-containing protein n=1 Tax=Thiomicrospira sp. ALE5 TaxID=748650 RepID=UPI0008E21E08|nr:DNA repair protein RadC [Thiomicrospira sp. ALE5]SFR52701.1 DNA repair protein RadC [Thiomicrospira sp. ALE5]
MSIPKPFQVDELTGYYQANQPLSPKAIIAMANYLSKQALKKGVELTSPQSTYEYLQNLLQDLEHEVFGVLCLDQQHRLIKYVPLFRGTVNQASVYPRELVKLALACNAAAMILVHNHPSGKPTPSESDRAITQTIKQALRLVEVRVMDHVIVGREGYVSMAERGEV